MTHKVEATIMTAIMLTAFVVVCALIVFVMNHVPGWLGFGIACALFVVSMWFYCYRALTRDTSSNAPEKEEKP